MFFSLKLLSEHGEINPDPKTKYWDTKKHMDTKVPFKTQLASKANNNLRGNTAI